MSKDLNVSKRHSQMGTAHVLYMKTKTQSQNITPKRGIGNTPTLALSRVAWISASGKPKSEPAGKALLDRELYLARASRVGNRYPGQSNYHGLKYFSNTGTQLWHESLMERRFLLTLDFTDDVVAIAAQPMKMDFADGSSHFPDFIALHADQRQVVYNVKPASLIKPKVQIQFDNAAALCLKVGWTHAVVSSFEPAVIANIEWLANFRNAIFRTSPKALDQLFTALAEPASVADAAASMTDAALNSAIPAIYHLAWQGELRLDLSRPLSNATLVRKAFHAHS